MQKKHNKNRKLNVAFATIATALLSCSFLPVNAAGTTLLSDKQEVHVYALSSSDSDPVGSLKTQMIQAIQKNGIELDPASTTLSVNGLDDKKTGIQQVTLNLSTGKDTLSTGYTETAEVSVSKSLVPQIQLTTESIDLYTEDTFNPSSYIHYLYDASGNLPVLRESDNVDTSTVGTYTAVYTVVNLEGLTSTDILTVNVTGPSPEAIAAQEAEEAAAKAEAEKAAAAAAITYSSAGNTQYGTSGANPYAGGWSNCTWGAWQCVYQNLGISLPSFGDASSWLASAQAYGYATGSSARAGSVAVYAGHVAYVQAVSADGSQVYLQEGGYNGGYNERWTSAANYALIGYIYL